MNPLFHTDCSISDSLKIVLKSVLIYETIIDGASNEIGDMSDILELDGILDKITIEDALKKLPDELQEVIIFHYFRDLKLSEIAELLQVGLPLVKYRIQRARLLLKNLLKED